MILAKINWKFWKGFILGGLATLATVVVIITSVAGTFKRAKPQILAAKKCYIIRYDAPAEAIDANCELFIYNKGTKDCSVISIDLTWLNGSDIELDDMPLPMIIPANSTKKVTIGGCSKFEFRPERQTKTEATVKVEFDTKHICEKKITFTVI